MSRSIVFQSVFCSNRTAEYSDLQSTKELLTGVLAQEPGKPKGMARASSQLLMGLLMFHRKDGLTSIPCSCGN